MTGVKYASGAAFDATSDLDVALSGESIFNAAREAGIRLRGGGVRTGPLSDLQANDLGLVQLQAQLTASTGRDVTFMIYRSEADVAARGPYTKIL